MKERALSRVGATIQQKYRINRLLGIGGMAAVYAATHRNGHRVAIKFLLDHLLDDPNIYRLFSREAYVANQVGHPGAVPVLDDDVDDEGCAFLIMPLLEGETLRTRWERAQKRLSLDEVCVFASDVLAVLDAAHAKGIVHRDIKPDNLFLTTEGDVKVLDFGIARRSETDGSVSMTGPMIGTPAFMPPEQALGHGRAIGPHSDCWAVGATMFSLLSGEYVHPASSGGAQLAAAATKHARSLAEALPEAHAAIVKLVDKALAFEVGDRWQSAKEMREALAKAYEEAAGAPLSGAAARVQAELVDELAPASSDEGATERGQVDAAGGSPAEGVPEAAPEGPARVPSARPERSENGRSKSQTLTVLEAGITRGRASKGHRAWGVILGGAVAVGAALALMHVYGRKETTASVVKDGAAEFSLTNPPATGVRATAQEAFNAGIQLWLDNSYWEARERFLAAADADPTFARAHLFAVLTYVATGDTVRLHYRKALDLRSNLDEVDKRILDALGPSVQDPPDLAETERRLSEIVTAHPHVLLASALARRRLALDRPQDALAVFNTHDFSTQSPAIVHGMIADVAIAEGRADDAKKALALCLGASPTSANCLRTLTVLQGHDGACAEAEATSRRWIAAWPNDAEPYEWLANALYGRTRSVESARTALERKWQLTGESERDITRASDMTYLALLDGDIREAKQQLDVWEHLASLSSDADVRATPAELRLDLSYEMDPAAQVRANAQRDLERSAAWTEGSLQDFRVTTTRILLRTGGTTEDQVLRDREAWMATDRNGIYASNARRWFNFFAETAVTPRLAADAIAHLPQERPFFGPYACDTECDEIVGETFATAGDYARALPHLERASKACAVDWPIHTLRARFLLGNALAALGRRDEACNAYRNVVTTWSRVRGSRVVRDATARLVLLQCKPPTE